MGKKEITRSAEIHNDSVQNQRQSVNPYENAVFVSYAWGGESEQVVNELEEALHKHGIHLVRDKKELGYKDSIKEFERRIGQGQCIVLVISNKYLRSVHCMYELLEVSKNQNLRKRIFPIVLADAQIYDPIKRLDYVNDWTDRVRKLDQAIKKQEVIANLEGVYADLEKYVHIRDSFDGLTELLSDMNTLTPEMHEKDGFSALISAIEGAMQEQRNDFRTKEQPEVITLHKPGQANTFMLRGAVVVVFILLLIVFVPLLTRMLNSEPPPSLATVTSMPSILPATLMPLPALTPWPLGNQTTTDPRPACRITVSDAPEPGREHVKALQFSITGPNGFCSWIVPLHGYNASGKKQVTFWVKGMQGGEEFKVGIKDRNTPSGQEPKEPEQASASWTQVSIPLDRFENLDLSSLENVSLNFTAGSGTIYVDQLIFMP